MSAAYIRSSKRLKKILWGTKTIGSLNAALGTCLCANLGTQCGYDFTLTSPVKGINIL